MRGQRVGERGERDLSNEQGMDRVGP